MKNNRVSHRQGFALIVSLAIMSLILLLILSMSAMMRVQIAESDSTQLKEKARLNALLGLKMGIGELQKYAGLDTRVTARAEVLGDSSVKNSYWTGVWDASSANSQPMTWLVSGNVADPKNGTEGNYEIVGKNAVANEDSKVSVPVVTYLDPGGGTNAYSYWVGDEGVKASVGLYNDVATASSSNLPYLSFEQAVRIEQNASAKTGFDLLLGKSLSALGDANAIRQQLTKMERIEALPLLPNLQINDSMVKQFYHDLTDLSLSTLTSTTKSATGATLKEDLSLSQNADPAIRQYLDSYKQVVSGDVYNKTIPVTTSTITAVADKANFSIHPVLSEMFLGFAFYATDLAADGTMPTGYRMKLRGRITFFAELWNPFNMGLDMGAANDIRNFRIKIKNLPSLTMSTLNQTTSAQLHQTTPINFQTEWGSVTQAGNPLVITLPYKNQMPWRAGQVVNWAGIRAQGGVNITNDANKDFFRAALHHKDKQLADGSNLDDFMFLGFAQSWRDYKINLPAMSTPQLTTDQLDFIVEQVDTNDVSLIVELYYVDPNDGSEKKLSTYSMPPFTAVDYPQDNLLNWKTRFGYHYRLKDSNDSKVVSGNNPNDWLKTTDVRNPTLDSTSYSAADYGNDTNLYTYSNVTVEIPQQTLNRAGGSISQSILNGSQGGVTAYTQDPDIAKLVTNPSMVKTDDVPLFEVPQEAPVSLGILQHVPVFDKRPFAIGNSWSPKEYLQYFDHYYLTGLSETYSLNTLNLSNHIYLPNPYLITDPQIRRTPQALAEVLVSNPQNMAKYLMVQGSFNINSTSVAAWESILSSHRMEDWTYFSRDNQDNFLAQVEKPFTRAFTRYPSTAMRGYDVDDRLFTQTKTYQRGLTQLTQSEVKTLASEIVRLIQARKKPFMSMAEFLEPGANGKSLMETAIANTSINNNWTAEEGGSEIAIDELSSSYLTQADLMTQLAPFVTNRSDTFKVRGSGEYTDLKGNKVTMTCEAILQRLPECVESSDSILNAPGGRKFKMKSFRWLTQ